MYSDIDNVWDTYEEPRRVYTITLEDGTRIENLTMNGNNYVSAVEIPKSVFDGNLGTVTISDGEYDDVHHNMELVYTMLFKGEYYFALADIPKEVLERRKMRSDIDYIGMMADLSF